MEYANDAALGTIGAAGIFCVLGVGLSLIFWDTSGLSLVYIAILFGLLAVPLVWSSIFLFAFFGLIWGAVAIIFLFALILRLLSIWVEGIS